MEKRNPIDRIVARASTDFDFLRQLLYNPKNAVKDGGFTLSDEQMDTLVAVLKLFTGLDKLKVLEDVIDAAVVGNIKPPWKPTEVIEALRDHQSQM